MIVLCVIDLYKCTTKTRTMRYIGTRTQDRFAFALTDTNCYHINTVTVDL